MRRGHRPLGALIAVAVAAVFAGSASAATPTDTTALQSAVKVGNDRSGIRSHLKELQVIADANGGNRATGSPGHAASLAYVKGKLEATGYWKVSPQPFTANVFTPLAAPTLSATPAPPSPWVADEDFEYMEFSGNGAVTNRAIQVIDFVAPTTQASASSSGCEATDFPAGGLGGKVAVIQRGTCDFGLKAENAQKAGASAVVLFNEGTIGDPDRNGLINGTLGGYAVTIPVLGATYETGKYLVDHPAATVSLSSTTKVEALTTNNLIAETKTGRTDRTIISGAHLDSVPEGPGINDDGSGSATQLEIALQMAKLGIKPVNQVRFIWFSGEEQGLFGSIHYADNLSKSERSSVIAMLDFDMLASPNYALQIYDGDGSEFGVAGPNGSGTVESVFQKFYDARGLYTERIAFDGRSDYDEFTVVGIPAGGIAAGAEVHKTPFQQSKWGGTVSDTLAGQFDPCYHLACDSYGIKGHPDNINDTALDINSDAVAHSVLTFASTTSSVNGTDSGSSNSTKDYEWKGSHRVK